MRSPSPRPSTASPDDTNAQTTRPRELPPRTSEKAKSRTRTCDPRGEVDDRATVTDAIPRAKTPTAEHGAGGTDGAAPCGTGRPVTPAR